MRQLRKEILVSLGIILLGIVTFSFYASMGYAESENIGGGSVYYKITTSSTWGVTLTYPKAFDLELHVYDDAGNPYDTGVLLIVNSSITGRWINEYAAGTFYLEINYVSGTGPAIFTLETSGVNTIEFRGTTAPYFTEVDKYIVMVVILCLGFGIIAIFGRMKLRPRKEPSVQIQVPLATTAPQRLPDQQENMPPVRQNCLQCGGIIEKGDQFCRKCGAPVPI